MGMRRHMKAAAAASILFLAAGTGAAQAQNPLFDQESYLAGWRVMAAIGRVDVQVTGLTVPDSSVEEVSVTWILSNEDESIAGKQSGYCMRVRFPGEDWQEECVSEAPTSATTFPRVTTYYREGMTVEFPESGTFSTAVQVKMKYEPGAYTSWSPEYERFLEYAAPWAITGAN